MTDISLKIRPNHKDWSKLNLEMMVDEG